MKGFFSLLFARFVGAAIVLFGRRTVIIRPTKNGARTLVVGMEYAAAFALMRRLHTNEAHKSFGQSTAPLSTVVKLYPDAKCVEDKQATRDTFSVGTAIISLTTRSYRIFVATKYDAAKSGIVCLITR